MQSSYALQALERRDWLGYSPLAARAGRFSRTTAGRRGTIRLGRGGNVDIVDGGQLRRRCCRGGWPIDATPPTTTATTAGVLVHVDRPRGVERLEGAEAPDYPLRRRLGLVT